MDDPFCPKATPPNMALKPWLLSEGPNRSLPLTHPTMSPVNTAGPAGKSHHILSHSITKPTPFKSLFISCAANRQIYSFVGHFVGHSNSPITLTPVVSNNLECRHQQQSVRLIQHGHLYIFWQLSAASPQAPKVHYCVFCGQQGCIL